MLPANPRRAVSGASSGTVYVRLCAREIARGRVTTRQGTYLEDRRDPGSCTAQMASSAAPTTERDARDWLTNCPHPGSGTGVVHETAPAAVMPVWPRGHRT